MLLLYLVLVSSVCTLAAGTDCNPPTDENCNGIVDSNILHPWPCNCHRYWQCVDGDLIGTDCAPYSLVFDPLIEQCVQDFAAPPGICRSTPDGPTSTAKPTDAPTTPTTAKPTTTTAKPTTTTAKPTTTTAKTTTTAVPITTTPQSCFACPGCTCENPPANQDNFFRPTPGTDCHEYYECIHNSADRPECEWSSVGYDCGAWIFNPNQASCASPEVATCNQ